MEDPPLYVFDAASISFVPEPVEFLGGTANLNNQIAGEVSEDAVLAIMAAFERAGIEFTAENGGGRPPPKSAAVV
jgi:hypothetical protein